MKLFGFRKGKANEQEYGVVGMHCTSCAAMIESDLLDAGIDARCSYAKQKLTIKNIGEKSEKDIMKIVKKTGYTLVPKP